MNININKHLMYTQVCAIISFLLFYSIRILLSVIVFALSLIVSLVLLYTWLLRITPFQSIIYSMLSAATINTIVHISNLEYYYLD